MWLFPFSSLIPNVYSPVYLPAGPAHCSNASWLRCVPHLSALHQPSARKRNFHYHIITHKLFQFFIYSPAPSASAVGLCQIKLSGFYPDLLSGFTYHPVQCMFHGNNKRKWHLEKKKNNAIRAFLRNKFPGQLRGNILTEQMFWQGSLKIMTKHTSSMLIERSVSIIWSLIMWLQKCYLNHETLIFLKSFSSVIFFFSFFIYS